MIPTLASMNKGRASVFKFIKVYCFKAYIFDFSGKM